MYCIYLHNSSRTNVKRAESSFEEKNITKLSFEECDRAEELLDNKVIKKIREMKSEKSMLRYFQ